MSSTLIVPDWVVRESCVLMLLQAGIDKSLIDANTTEQLKEICRKLWAMGR